MEVLKKMLGDANDSVSKCRDVLRKVVTAAEGGDDYIGQDGQLIKEVRALLGE